MVSSPSHFHTILIMVKSQLAHTPIDQSRRRARGGYNHPAREEGGMSVGEAAIKAAVRWIDDQLREDPTADRLTLVDQASRRFDLTPLDADFLLRHLAERQARP